MLHSTNRNRMPQTPASTMSSCESFVVVVLVTFKASLCIMNVYRLVPCWLVRMPVKCEATFGSLAVASAGQYESEPKYYDLVIHRASQSKPSVFVWQSHRVNTVVLQLINKLQIPEGLRSEVKAV